MYYPVAAQQIIIYLLFLTIRCQMIALTIGIVDGAISNKPGDRSVFNLDKKTSNSTTLNSEMPSSKNSEFTSAPGPLRDHSKISKSPEDYNFKSVNLWEDGVGLFMTIKQMGKKEGIIKIGISCWCGSQAPATISYDLVTE